MVMMMMGVGNDDVSKNAAMKKVDDIKAGAAHKSLSGVLNDSG